MVKQRIRFSETLIGIAVIVTAWIVLSLWIGDRLIPGPIMVLATLRDLILYKHLGLHLLHSLYRIAMGILLALAFGIPLGLAAGMSASANRIVSPVVYLLYPVPKIAFLPLFMVLFGLGDLSKVILVFTIIVFQIVIAVRDSVKEIPKELHYAVQTLGLDRSQIYRDLIIPSAMPKIMSALRVSLGISISVLFFGENYATRYGIGYFIMNSWIMVNYEQMFAGIVALSLMGILLFKCIDLLERRLCKWLYIQ